MCLPFRVWKLNNQTNRLIIAILYMKILILSCDTGEGHNSAAKAFMEYLSSHNVECQMADTLSLVSPAVSQAVSDLYLFSTRTRLFRVAYKAGQIVSEGTQIKSPVYLANRLYCKKLYDYITQNGYDTVVCTHLFPAEALTALRRSGKLPQKSVFIMTDYTCIPFMKETEMDAYVVPHEHLIEECVQKGLPRERLYPYGIPVKSVFHSEYPKDEARFECRKIFGEGLTENAAWFLLMSGSMGFGNSADTVRELLSRCPEGSELFLVCGNNANLNSRLKKEFGSCPGVHMLGFTDKIPLLMDACDVVFTKPGGLSSTEAAAKGLPIIHTAPIPGCETRNAEFFHYHNMSYSSLDVSQQVTVALKLCNDRSYRERMVLSQKFNSHPLACRHILELCCS